MFSMQVSAYRSREPSGHCSCSVGPYWVNIVAIQRSSSVSEGSIEEGTSISTYGFSAGTPRTASCQARSR